MPNETVNMNAQPANGSGDGNDDGAKVKCGEETKKSMGKAAVPPNSNDGHDDEEEYSSSDEEESLEDGPVDHQLLPPDMKLTEDEVVWAWNIKVYVEAPGSDIEPLCDMDYALHAVVARGNISEAVERIKGLQRFRRLYRIQDTVQEGIQVLQDFVRFQPGVLVTVDVCGDKGEAILAWNQSACNPSKTMESEEECRKHLMLIYYLLKIQQPTLHAVRAGAFQLIEGKDMSWENFDQTFETRLYDEIWSISPLKVRQVMVYNANTVVNCAWGLMKRRVRQDLRKAVILGCQIEWNSDPSHPKLSLCDLYFQPTMDEAMEQMVERAKQLLTQHYYNEAIFRL